MKGYKRLTKRKDDGSWGWADDIAKSCHYISADRLGDRLCELEDKIEKGLLVELPCKEGDIVYFVNWYRPTPRIEAFKVNHLEVNKNYIRVACYDFENEDDYSMYRMDSKDISVSKEEAEEVLKKYKKLKRNT